MSMVRLHMMHDRFVFRPEKLRSLAKCRLRDFIVQSITSKTIESALQRPRGALCGLVLIARTPYPVAQRCHPSLVGQ